MAEECLGSEENARVMSNPITPINEETCF
ncbi:hypothetical protein JL09_g6689 [Pichia kudriavzevii]|uniref:Uncharacterized protein n=1 Tax=Pichia kudriavzevii TaxID=4909 RepID=A0A099NKS9_PICKU|nr:hypothetical protein JL09_g6689 [Pichia kudriavzevii]